jgi:hypothetical protein
MCHERWVRHSEEAVARAWLRDLSQREPQDEAFAAPQADEQLTEDRDTILETAGFAADR